MKTVEKRAEEYAGTPLPTSKVRELRVIDYTKGATEQKAIDIEKACEWLKDSLFFGEDGICIGSYTDTMESILDDFRKAMEDTK